MPFGSPFFRLAKKAIKALEAISDRTATAAAKWRASIYQQRYQKKIRAFLLADYRRRPQQAQFLRESSSTPALVDLVWSTAAKLGYTASFRNDATSAEDDHDSFLKRGVPAVDVIGTL